jgi:hypothetical protein
MVWNILDQLITGVNSTPVYGIKLNVKSEKIPDILTNEEIKKFLFEAKRLVHPLYSI